MTKNVNSNHHFVYILKLHDDQIESKLFSIGLHEEPLLTISAICPNVMQGQKQVIKPSKHKN